MLPIIPHYSQILVCIYYALNNANIIYQALTRASLFNNPGYAPAISLVPDDYLEVMIETSKTVPVVAGSEDLTLTCTVNEVIDGLTNIPSAQWMITTGLVITGDDITVTEAVGDERTTTVTLSFSSLHTSHAGVYMCQGTLDLPANVTNFTSTPTNVSINVRCKLLSVYDSYYLMSINTVPTPTSTLSIPSGTLYEGTLQTMTCTITLPDTVDTDVTVIVDWVLDSTNTIITTTSDRVMVSPASGVMSPFISTLTFNPLIMNDAGQYSCHATANSSSQYITTSSPGSSSVKTITVTGILTCIVI